MAFFNNADSNDKRIVKGSNGYSHSDYWTYPTGVSKTPDAAGVYIFFDASKQIQYIGKAGAGRLRAEIQAKAGVKDFNTAYFRWFLTGSDAAALSLEADWIAKYAPIRNVQKNPLWPYLEEMLGG